MNNYFNEGVTLCGIFFCLCYTDVGKVRKVRTMEDKDERFIVSVKVGPKGQITIPAEARKVFDIKEGDTLMVMGDKSKGIALLKADLFYTLMEGKQNG